MKIKKTIQPYNYKNRFGTTVHVRKHKKTFHKTLNRGIGIGDYGTGVSDIVGAEARSRRYNQWQADINKEDIDISVKQELAQRGAEEDKAEALQRQDIKEFLSDKERRAEAERVSKIPKMMQQFERSKLLQRRAEERASAQESKDWIPIGDLMKSPKSGRVDKEKGPAPAASKSPDAVYMKGDKVKAIVEGKQGK